MVLDKKSVTEMKFMTNPPKEVKTVMEAVCILNDVDVPKK